MSKRRSVRLAETSQEPLGRASIGQAFVVEKSSLPGRASRRTARRILGRISRRSGRFAPRASAERLCALKRFALAANKATAGRFAAQAAPAPRVIVRCCSLPRCCQHIHTRLISPLLEASLPQAATMSFTMMPPSSHAPRSFYKCSFCRERKRKCLPVDRSWPAQKCEPCRRGKPLPHGQSLSRPF